MSHVPYTPPPPGPPQRKGMSPVVVVLLTLGTVVVLAMAGALAYSLARPKPVTITGSVTLTDGVDGGGTCQGSGGYADIRGGTSVVVHDSTGKVVATGQLEEGIGGPGILTDSDIAFECKFPFTLEDVPRQKFYGVEVSHRGTVQFSAQQVSKGPVALSLGNS